MHREPAELPPGRHLLAEPPASRSGAALDFQEVYRTHFRFAWRTLRHLGVREADVMDIAQNVFLVIHRKLPEFEGRSTLRTWIFAICRRAARDYRRSAPVRREFVVDAAELRRQMAGALIAPSDVDARNLTLLAEAALGKLPEKLREVFVLFELEQMSGDEIAALLEIPVGSVRSRLRLARDAFRREVARLEAPPLWHKEAV
jgi:RNA polymerase sigma-70 factor (ECF subfamily)